VRLASSQIAVAAALLALLGACNDGLRGDQRPSSDCETYPLFEKVDGPACKTVYVNGRAWPYKVGVSGEVPPGQTVVKCWGEVRFNVKAGYTFRLNY